MHHKLLVCKTHPTRLTVNSEELGIAIGNTANHEVGHMVGLDDEVVNTGWIMSDVETDEHKLSPKPSSWSPHSENWLKSRFK